MVLLYISSVEGESDNSYLAQFNCHNKGTFFSETIKDINNSLFLNILFITLFENLMQLYSNLFSAMSVLNIFITKPLKNL